MADVPATFTGLGALLVAVLGAAAPVAATAPLVTAPAALVARVGSPTTIAGASASGFGTEPLRLVIGVSSGVLELPATIVDLTVPAGYPALGKAAPQLAIEGEEAAVNAALAALAWTPAAPGPAEITLDVTPAGAAYEPEGAHADPLAEDDPMAGRVIAGLRAAEPPSAPVMTEIRAGVTEAIVEWQPPAVDGGAPVLGFVVSGDPGGWCTVPTTQTSCVLRGLVGGAAHTFRVVAINEVGLGAWSEPSAPVVPTAAAVPDAPAAAAAPAPPTVDTVNTSVQPFPRDVVINLPVDQTTVPAEPGAGDIEQPPVDGEAASAPGAPPARPRSTTPTSTAAAFVDVGTITVDPPAAGAFSAENTPPSPAGPGTEPPAVSAPAGAGTTLAGTPTITVVFNVGPGAGLGDARFTVRGTQLGPGTVVTVVAHSEPIVVGTVEVGADGTLEWTGALPADLADGDHSLIATGVGHDGSKVERTIAFTAESGRLVRIGASASETVAPAVSTTARRAEPAADALASSSSSEPEASGGGVPRRALLLLGLLGAAAVLLWRARSRRASSPGDEPTAQQSAGAAPASAGRAEAPSSPAGLRSLRSHHPTSPGARHHSRRQPARSV